MPALAYSLAWLGSSLGGIPMGRAAERFGIRFTVMFGATMIAVGLVIAQSGGQFGLPESFPQLCDFSFEVRHFTASGRHAGIDSHVGASLRETNDKRRFLVREINAI